MLNAQSIWIFIFWYFTDRVKIYIFAIRSIQVSTYEILELSVAEFGFGESCVNSVSSNDIDC